MMKNLLMLLAVLTLPVGVNAQECADPESRIGAAYSVVFDSLVEDESIAYMGPLSVGNWRLHPLYEIGYEDVVEWVDFLETLALNVTSIYDCEPGSLATLAVLSDLAKAHEQDATELVKFTARNPLERLTYMFIADTAKAIRILIDGGWDPSAGDDDIAEKLMVDVRDIDWRDTWHDLEADVRENDPEFWNTMLRLSFQ